LDADIADADIADADIRLIVDWQLSKPAFFEASHSEANADIRFLRIERMQTYAL
jgi:hypothetical protein